VTLHDQPTDGQLADIAELVRSGPVDLGAYTQAELVVVLGNVPALAGVPEVALAEAVRSLAARGVLYRGSGSDTVEVVGDLGLVVALMASAVGALDIRRGHAGPDDEPWRWLVATFPNGVVAVDRIDALGLHRLALHSTTGVAQAITTRLIGGRARVPRGQGGSQQITDEEMRALTERASLRWQLIQRVARPDGTRLEIDAIVVRTGPDRVELITRTPDGAGYQRAVVNERALRGFVTTLAELR